MSGPFAVAPHHAAGPGAGSHSATANPPDKHHYHHHHFQQYLPYRRRPSDSQQLMRARVETAVATELARPGRVVSPPEKV